MLVMTTQAPRRVRLQQRHQTVKTIKAHRRTASREQKATRLS